MHLSEGSENGKSFRFEPGTLIVEAEARINWTALRTHYKERGIMCLNCPAAEIETFEQGAKLHKFDLGEHLAALNRLIEAHPLRDDAAPAQTRFWARLFGSKGGSKNDE